MYNLFQSSQCQKVSFQKLNKLKNLINAIDGINEWKKQNYSMQ